MIAYDALNRYDAIVPQMNLEELSSQLFNLEPSR
jgi:hypothetical protein